MFYDDLKGWEIQKRGIYIYVLWMVHFTVQQKITHCKATTLQSISLKNNFLASSQPRLGQVCLHTVCWSTHHLVLHLYVGLSVVLRAGTVCFHLSFSQHLVAYLPRLMFVK